jgi:hypothetical protein
MSHGESFLVKASNVCKPAITFDLEQYFSPWSGTANITQEFNGYWSDDQMHILKYIGRLTKCQACPQNLIE